MILFHHVYKYSAHFYKNCPALASGAGISYELYLRRDGIAVVVNPLVGQHGAERLVVARHGGEDNAGGSTTCVFVLFLLGEEISENLRMQGCAFQEETPVVLASLVYAKYVAVDKRIGQIKPRKLAVRHLRVNAEPAPDAEVKIETAEQAHAVHKLALNTRNELFLSDEQQLIKRVSPVQGIDVPAGKGPLHLGGVDGALVVGRDHHVGMKVAVESALSASADSGNGLGVVVLKGTGNGLLGLAFHSFLSPSFQVSSTYYEEVDGFLKRRKPNPLNCVIYF